MKQENRLMGMIIALLIFVTLCILQIFQYFKLEILSWILGIAIGYALRDSLEPIENKEN